MKWDQHHSNTDPNHGGAPERVRASALDRIPYTHAVTDLSINDARRVARLARLAVPEPRLETFRAQLGAILDHMRSLNELNLDGVEPLARPTDDADRWDTDVPRAGLPNQELMDIAPDVSPPYIKVPKVLGD